MTLPFRPHCRTPDACIARGDGHCRSCNATRLHADEAFKAKIAASRHVGPRKKRSAAKPKPVRHPKRPTPLSLTRIPGRGGKGGRPFLPPFDHPALVEGRSIFPGKVLPVTAGIAVLKSGHNNPKVGKQVVKGRWAGFPIFTLSLEERATCPRSCLHWRTCYMNSVHFGERFRAGPDLEERIVREVVALHNRFRHGFVVRLHVAGDFYSVRYVRVWHALMSMVPTLHVFGYTARIDPSDPITIALGEICREFRDRWWLRFSDADMDTMATEVVEMPEHATPGAIVCPAQTGKTQCCATCALCWTTRRNIAFLRH